MIPDVSVLVCGDPQQQIAVDRTQGFRQLCCPAGRQVDINLFQLDAGVIHHHRHLVAAVGDLAQILQTPVNIRKPMPRRWGRISRYAQYFAGDRRAQFIQQRQKIRVPVRHWLNVDLNTSKPGMRVHEIRYGIDKVLPPLHVGRTGGRPEDSADPRDDADAELLGKIQKTFGLVMVATRDYAVRPRRTQMRIDD